MKTTGKYIALALCLLLAAALCGCAKTAAPAEPTPEPVQEAAEGGIGSQTPEEAPEPEPEPLPENLFGTMWEGSWTNDYFRLGFVLGEGWYFDPAYVVDSNAETRAAYDGDEARQTAAAIADGEGWFDMSADNDILGSYVSAYLIKKNASMTNEAAMLGNYQQSLLDGGQEGITVLSSEIVSGQLAGASHLCIQAVIESSGVQMARLFYAIEQGDYFLVIDIIGNAEGNAAAASLFYSLDAPPAEPEPVAEEPAPIVLPGMYDLYETYGEDASSHEDVELLASLGLTCTLELREDGYVVLSLFGEVAEGTWDGYGVTIDGETAPIIIEGDRLLVGEDGDILVFVPAGAVPADVPVEEPVPAEAPAGGEVITLHSEAGYTADIIAAPGELVDFDYVYEDYAITDNYSGDIWPDELYDWSYEFTDYYENEEQLLDGETGWYEEDDYYHGVTFSEVQEADVNGRYVRYIAVWYTWSDDMYCLDVYAWSPLDGTYFLTYCEWSTFDPGYASPDPADMVRDIFSRVSIY